MSPRTKDVLRVVAICVRNGLLMVFILTMFTLAFLGMAL